MKLWESLLETPGTAKLGPSGVGRRVSVWPNANNQPGSLLEQRGKVQEPVSAPGQGKWMEEVGES